MLKLGAACGSAVLNDMFRMKFAKQLLGPIGRAVVEDTGRPLSEILDMAVREFETMKKRFNGSMIEVQAQSMIRIRIPGVRENRALGLLKDYIPISKYVIQSGNCDVSQLIA